jgi:hypothetical protein
MDAACRVLDAFSLAAVNAFEGSLLALLLFKELGMATRNLEKILLQAFVIYVPLDRRLHFEQPLFIHTKDARTRRRSDRGPEPPFCCSNKKASIPLTHSVRSLRPSKEL